MLIPKSREDLDKDHFTLKNITETSVMALKW
jgi:hypothetical protein